MQLYGQILSAVPPTLVGLLLILIYRLLAPYAQATAQLRTRGRGPGQIFAWAAAYLGLFIVAACAIVLILIALGRAAQSETAQPRATVTVMAPWQPTPQEVAELRAEAKTWAAGLEMATRETPQCLSTPYSYAPC